MRMSEPTGMSSAPKSLVSTIERCSSWPSIETASEVTSLEVGIEGQDENLSIVETNDFGADDIPVGSDIRITYDRDAFVIMQG